MKVIIRREALSSPTAAGLIGALNRELTAQYPEPGATHFRLDPAETAGGMGAFVVVWVDGEARGCGAIRRLDGEAAELKRMYVAPDFRGPGLGRALLDALEREARGLGVRRLVLETGTRQTAAIALYHRAGFADIPPFGEYCESPTSLCMAKDL